MPMPSARTRAVSTLVLTAGLLLTGPLTATHASAGTQAASVHSCTYRSTVGYTCDYYYGTETISAGSSNAAAVREIQDIINVHTDYPIRIAVDGSFGSRTLTAVRWLQSHHHITGGADGIVGGHTWAYLRR